MKKTNEKKQTFCFIIHSLSVDVKEFILNIAIQSANFFYKERKHSEYKEILRQKSTANLSSFELGKKY